MPARSAQRSLGSLTDRHRADPIKAGGIHYTPPSLAAFVAEQAVVALEVMDSVRVLDPACGDGALLASAAQALPGTIRSELYGFDLDPTALHEAQYRLQSLPKNRTVALEKIDFIDAVLDEKESTESLFVKPDVVPLAGRFDLVIANPPYVRTQVLGADKSRRLAADFGLSGRVDLYHAFAMAMAVALRPRGIIALLCSNRFLTTKSGEDMRKMLRSAFEIVAIYDLGDTKAFEAAVLPAVVIARRNDEGTERFPMISIYENRSGTTAPKKVPSVFHALTTETVDSVETGDRVYDVRRGHVDTSDPRRPWVPTGTSDGWLVDVDAAAVMRFGDVGKVRVGVKTTADVVFIREDWEGQRNVPEPDLLLPLITHHIARPWQADVPRKKILYPYRLDIAKRSPVDLADWPATVAYLDEHREQLSGRKYVIDGGRHWWEIWVPQRPAAWAAPKIVCPDISEEPKFFYDKTGAVVNGDCYWLTVEDERMAYLMMAIANSALGRDYYDSVCGNKLYAGRRRYITQYVERFPIPDPTQPVVGEIVEAVQGLIDCRVPGRALELEEELNRLVRRSFGLE
ncbi:MAG: N-6 DNA methylase [Actinomycetota bacterium]|nr:N-6 DNA methylase [Actinomycetota bacterium]